MSFLEELAQRGIIKKEQIAEITRRASTEHEGDPDPVLIEMGLPEEELMTLKSEHYSVPTKKVNQKGISFDLLKYVPEDSAKHYKFVPIGITDNVLEIGIVNPGNIEAMDALQFIAGNLNIPFKIYLISSADLEQVLNNYRGITGEVDKALGEFDSDMSINTDEVLTGSDNPQDKLKPGEEAKIVEDAPIIKIVAVILRHATEGNASDIHIENTGDKVKVRFRVDGILHTSLVLPLNVYAGVVARIKILAKLRLDEKRKPQDGGFSAKIEGRKIDFRVSTLPAYYGEKVVMRILDSDRGVKPLDQLGLSKHNMALVREALARPYGLILITGPTGSGKTTTLYSMINELDREKANVVSLEDPVEYHIPDMNQSQVMPEIGYTFATGLRSVLRQDPDIIMVGEIRDKETAQLAIQAALTGHLVFSTLHTNNSIGVIPRLIDMGVDPYLIAPTLVLSIAQRLARVICPSSKKPVAVDEGIKMMMEKQFKDLPEEYKNDLGIGDTLHEAAPSGECPSGTRGRIAVFEMFKVDREMQAVILKNPTEPEIYKLARASGMLTMKEDALKKSAEGTVPLQEVYNFE
jgi:type IV pilus assembly protein PilB